MIQEIASFVDPDPTVEFDPASRVSRHASLKCASLLSFFLSFSLFSQPPSLSVQRLFLSARNFSLLFFLFPLRVSLSHSLSLSLARTLTVVLVRSTKTKEATGPARSEKRRASKEEEEEEEGEKGETNLGARRNRA